MNTALFAGLPPGVTLMAEIPLTHLIVNLIWQPVHLLWVWAGIRVQAMGIAPDTQRRVNLAMVAALALVVMPSVLKAFGYSV